jgi:autotransporter-associated beta strand protein
VSLVVNGAGTQILSGANTYSGGTTVMNGTLLANNSTGSATGSAGVAVGDATNANSFHGKLAGTGSVAGPVSIYKGSTLSAGDGATTTGTLALPGSANTMADGSNYLWKIDNAAGTAGAAVGWDKIVFSSLSVTNNGTGGTGIVDVIPTQIGSGALYQFDSGSSYHWVIANVPGNGNALLANFKLDTAALSSFAQQNNVSPSQFSLGADANDLFVSYAAAPEPGALALFGLGSASLLLRRRRKLASR